MIRVFNHVRSSAKRLVPGRFIAWVAFLTFLTVPVTLWVHVRQGCTGYLPIIDGAIIVIVGSIMRLMVAPKEAVTVPASRFKMMDDYIDDMKAPYAESRRKAREQKLKTVVILIFSTMGIISPIAVQYLAPNFCTPVGVNEPKQQEAKSNARTDPGNVVQGAPTPNVERATQKRK